MDGRSIQAPYLPARPPVGGPRGQRRQPAARPRARRYWRNGATGISILLALTAVRLSDLLVRLAALKPVLLFNIALFAIFLSRTSNAVVQAALRDRQVRLAASYAFWGMIMIPFALYKRTAFETLFILLNGVMLTFLVQLVEPNKAALDRIERALTLAAVLLGAWAVRTGKTVEAGRLTTSGTFDSNDLAALTATILPLALSQAITDPRWRRVLWGASAGALLLVIARTASRGGMIGAAAGVLVLVGAQNFKRTMQFTVLLIVGTIGMWRLGPPVFRERFESLFSLSEDYNTNTDEGRLGIWKRGLGYFIERPISGVGLSNYAEREGRRGRELGSKGKWTAAHNTFVQAFVETGLVGGVILLAMVWYAVKNGFAMWRPGPVRRRDGSTVARRPELFASLAAFLATGMFLSNAYSYMLFTECALLAWAVHIQGSAAPQEREPGGELPPPVIIT